MWREADSNTRSQCMQSCPWHKKANTASSTKISVDMGSYVFPQHIVATDLCPVIVCWDDSIKKLLLIELTICFETSFNRAAERKELKYEDLVVAARSARCRGQVITLQVGS